MVTTRHQSAEQEAQMERFRRVASSMKNPALLVLLVALLAYTPKIIIGTGHQAQGLWHSATGRHQPSEEKSWDAIKEWAASRGQVLPEPSKEQLLRSKKTSTPLVQIQMQDLLQLAQQGAAKQLGNAKDAASDFADAAAGKAGEYKAAAGSKAGEYMDAAKRRALPAPTLTQRFWSVATWRPVEQIQAEALYGDLKGRASGAVSYASDATGQVMDGARATANGIGSAVAPPKEGTFAKLKRWMTGRSQAETHYTAAKERAGDAGGHLSQAAREAYEATKAAGNAAAAGATEAWQADPAGKAAQASKNAAGAAYDAAKGSVDAAGSKYESAKDAASGYVEAGKEKAGEMYDSAAETVGATTGHAHTEAGLTAEKARHRAEEHTQKMKHAAEEKLHAATAEL